MVLRSVCALSLIAILPSCMSAGGIAGAPQSPILTTTGPAGPDFVPGRADADAFAVNRELREVEDRIDRGRDAGALSRKEARKLRKQSSVLRRVANDYADDGFTDFERRQIETVARVIQDQADIQSFNNANSPPD